jgi:hypothetical protein
MHGRGADQADIPSFDRRRSLFERSEIPEYFPQAHSPPIMLLTTALLLLATAVNVETQQARRARAPGVAFRLTPAYG